VAVAIKAPTKVTCLLSNERVAIWMTASSMVVVAVAILEKVTRTIIRRNRP